MAISTSYGLSFTFILTIWVVASVCLRADARAFFVFGDSLVDNGNNNYLVTSARADSPPYGIDYPTHRPTGRFSNGLNMPDLISRVSNIHTLLLTFIIYIFVDLIYTYNARSAHGGGAHIAVLEPSTYRTEATRWC